MAKSWAEQQAEMEGRKRGGDLRAYSFVDWLGILFQAWVAAVLLSPLLVSTSAIVSVVLAVCCSVLGSTPHQP